MDKQNDTLLQQFLDKNKESIVYLEIETDDIYNLEFEPEDIPTFTANGFYVEPDKIVTTIGVLTNAKTVVAFSENRYNAIKSYAIDRLGKKLNRMEFLRLSEYIDQKNNGNEDITIEGVTAYDVKSDLVLLKVDNKGVPFSIENSTPIQIDDPVYMTGYHQKLGYQGRIGFIQGKFSDNIRHQIKTEFITGGYGSPVRNKNGELIGIVTTGVDSDVEDVSTMYSIMVTSDRISSLIANSGDLIPLELWKKNARIRAYTKEVKGDIFAAHDYNREALNEFNTALKLNPDLPDIHSRIGRAKVRIGNYVGALRDFNKAIEKNPYDIFSYNNRANTKALLGDFQGALEDVNKAIQINPDYVLGNLNRGQINSTIADGQMESDNIQEARRYYQDAFDDLTKVLTLNPKNYIARNSLRYIKRQFKVLNQS